MSRWIYTSLILTALLQGGANNPPADPAYETAVRIEATGMVGPLFDRRLRDKLAVAREKKADLVIIEIDSPGGYLHTTRDLATELRKIKWARTVAYIPREALSGAAFIALACDDIVMHSDARLGDIGVIVEGEDSLFRHAPEKLVSDVARELSIIAKDKGHPAVLAEAMVDKDLEVYHVENKATGERQFLRKSQIDELDDPDQWTKPKLVVESEKGRFLEVSGKRAEELTIARKAVADFEGVKALYSLDQEPLRLQNTWVDLFVLILNHPIITGLLFVIGLVGLYLELQFPGLGVAGLVAGVCFTLFFWSRILGGTADLLEIVLFMGGLACVALELFVVPGFGVFGFSGILLMGTSLVLASQRGFIPESSYDLQQFVINFGVLTCSGVIFLAIAAGLSHYLGSVPLLGRIVLKPPSAEEQTAAQEFDEDTVTKSLGIGQIGKASTALRPTGKARFGSEFYNVVVEDDFVKPGEAVEIISLEDHQIVVRPAADA